MYLAFHGKYLVSIIVEVADKINMPWKTPFFLFFRSLSVLF